MGIMSAESREARKEKRRLNRQVEEAASKVSEAVQEPRGVVLETVLTLVTAFLPLLAKVLPCLNPKPVPPNPNPAPTPQESLAWSNAWAIKGRAEKAYREGSGSYDRHTLNQTANAIQNQKRKNGERIKQKEAVELAKVALDAARNTPHEEIAQTILEAQGQ